MLLLLLLLGTASSSNNSPSNDTNTNNNKTDNNDNNNNNHNAKDEKKSKESGWKEPDEEKPGIRSRWNNKSIMNSLQCILNRSQILGKWAVIDEEKEKSDIDRQRQHKGDDHRDKDGHRPACILAKMRASLVFPVRNADGKVNNRTINVPAKAEVATLFSWWDFVINYCIT